VVSSEHTGPTLYVEISCLDGEIKLQRQKDAGHLCSVRYIPTGMPYFRAGF